MGKRHTVWTLLHKILEQLEIYWNNEKWSDRRRGILLLEKRISLEGCLVKQPIEKELDMIIICDRKQPNNFISSN